jgi:multidrug resistance efflux pump
MHPVRCLFLVIGTSVLVYAGTANSMADETSRAKAKDAAVRAEIEAAEANLRAAEQNVKRAETLHKRGFLSEVELAKARLALEMARATLQAKQAEREVKSPKVTVAAPVEGIVTECLVKEGDRVQKGQVVVRLDDRLAQFGVERAKARLKAAEGELQAGEATLTEAQSRKTTADALHGRRAMTNEEHRSAVLAYDRAVANLATKRALLHSAAVDVREAELQLAMHVVHSPISGVVQKVHRSPGEGIRKFGPVVDVQPGE